jgi:hypothetical protein
MCWKLYLTSQNLLICSNGIYNNLATTPSIPSHPIHSKEDMFVDMLIDVIMLSCYHHPLGFPPTPNTNIDIKYLGKSSSMHKNFFNPSWVSISFVHFIFFLFEIFLENNLLFAYRLKVDQSKISNNNFLLNFEMDRYHTHIFCDYITMNLLVRISHIIKIQIGCWLKTCNFDSQKKSVAMTHFDIEMLFVHSCHTIYVSMVFCKL